MHDTAAVETAWRALKRKFHHASEHGPGPRVPLDRERRAQWRARVDLRRRARGITSAHQHVAMALLRRLGQDGRCDPSHATLANDAGVSDRTVRRALDRLFAAGLVRWTRRLTRNGWRTEQTSSAYELTLGDPPVLPRSRCGGQADRGSLKGDFSICAQDALARENAARMLRALGAAVPAAWGA